MTALPMALWGDAAPAWRRWQRQLSQQHRAATALLVRAIEPRPQMHVLDLACATGDVSVAAAVAVGPRGRVTAVDLVPEMLAGAEEQARAHGLHNIAFRQADAQALPFDDGTFDAITCRLAMPFFPDATLALRECRRVLAPGGRLCVLGWGTPRHNTLFAVRNALLPYVAPDAIAELPDPLRFSRRGALCGTIREAGFRQVHAAERAIPFTWPGSPENAWQAMVELQPTIRGLFESVPTQKRELALANVLDGVRPYYDGQQVNFTGNVLLATAQ